MGDSAQRPSLEGFCKTHQHEGLGVLNLQLALRKALPSLRSTLRLHLECWVASESNMPGMTALEGSARLLLECALGASTPTGMCHAKVLRRKAKTVQVTLIIAESAVNSSTLGTNSTHGVPWRKDNFRPTATAPRNFPPMVRRRGGQLTRRLGPRRPRYQPKKSATDSVSHGVHPPEEHR
jgi:hypothetical protein